MSVPTHNLYDFVHQVTKRKFFLMYFYPWGSRAIENICHHQTTTEFLDGPNGIDMTDRVDPVISDCNWALMMQPIIFCHDQEPLNFDIYVDKNPDMKKWIDHEKDYTIFISPLLKDYNLRTQITGGFQKTWILLHSELNSSELEKYESTGLFVGAYWWSHAMIARDWFRYAQHDKSLMPGKSRRRLFLSYCRETTGSRSYRNDYLNQLSDKKLLDSCQIKSFSNQVIDSNASAIYDSVDFNNTAISVVLETVFDDRIHLTEKILRPIACGHPFILAAGAGSLALLKKYGFKTFDPFINEDYDNEKDSCTRLQMITDEMNRLKNLSDTELESLLLHCKIIADHNRKHFFSEEFFKIITTELIDNVTKAYDKHYGELLFDFWWQDHKWRRKNQPHVCQSDDYRKFSKYLLPHFRKIRQQQSIDAK
jgi:hypothetical protein